MRERAKARALKYLPLLCKLRDSGEALHGVALQLTLMEIKTPGKRKVWRDRTVAKMFEYAVERNPRPRSSGRTQADRRVAQPDFQTSAAFDRPTRLHMLVDYASMRWDGKEIRSARRGGLFGWLRSRRRAERSVDETTRRLVKSSGADEPSLGPDPIEELVRIVGESDPCPGGDARFRQTSSRRARPNRRG
jgi:hypothetical protein